MSGFIKRNKYEYLDSFSLMYDLKFDQIRAYLENSQDMISRQEKKINKKYKKWCQEHEYNPEMPNAFDIVEEEIIISSEFPNILNQSIYLTVYSTFENEFFTLCEACQEIENLKIGPKDVKGRNYLEKCRQYCTKFLNINFDSLNEKWVEIRKYQLIRNSIAHNNGTIKSPKKDILEFIENSNGIKFDIKNSSIEIESIDFLKTMIDKFICFLLAIAELIMIEKN
jgi:hypothetical protein